MSLFPALLLYALATAAERSVVARKLAETQERIAGPLLVGVSVQRAGSSLQSLERELQGSQVRLRLLEGDGEPRAGLEAALVEAELPCGLLLRIAEERIGLSLVGECDAGAAAGVGPPAAAALPAEP